MAAGSPSSRGLGQGLPGVRVVLPPPAQRSVSANAPTSASPGRPMAAGGPAARRAAAQALAASCRAGQYGHSARGQVQRPGRSLSVSVLSAACRSAWSASSRSSQRRRPGSAKCWAASLARVRNQAACRPRPPPTRRSRPAGPGLLAQGLDQPVPGAERLVSMATIVRHQVGSTTVMLLRSIPSPRPRRPRRGSEGLGEYRHPPERGLRLGQQLVTPVEGGGQGALPVERGAAAAGQRRNRSSSRSAIPLVPRAGPGPRPARWPAAGRPAGADLGHALRRCRSRRKPGSAAMARSVNSRTDSHWRSSAHAGRAMRVGHGQRRHLPQRLARHPQRLPAGGQHDHVLAGRQRARPTARAALSIRYSQLSMTSSDRLPARPRPRRPAATDRSARPRPGPWPGPGRRRRRPVPGHAASSISHTPIRNRLRARWATSTPSRDLPQPPGPSSVISRRWPSRVLSSASAWSRPRSQLSRMGRLWPAAGQAGPARGAARRLAGRDLGGRAGGRPASRPASTARCSSSVSPSGGTARPSRRAPARA